ncbi:hypothetical protein M413DRAFT_447483 [Hebeloma cylindrosporum]|uniref:Uncharacterized protein n=1 Tax=Hebeloma cylindrosporum TaxID=76867 RepID=A0A0C3C4I2_HEBCY|nr:hypothetical protein M413DRAFT_447483 [Hebeloma cylindrosporum h7]
MLSVSQTKTEPTSWLTTQSLGSLFKSERQKRGVWALTQLPDGHLKSLTQQWTVLKLKYGECPVLQVSGEGVSTLAKLKLDLYHPANNAVAYQLVGFWDEKLREACMNSTEEWVIAMVETLYESLDQGPQLLDSYSDYLLQAARWQVDSFASAGYSETLHSCNMQLCSHEKYSMEQLYSLICNDLMALKAKFTLPFQQKPSQDQRKAARKLGLHLYGLLSSYILLSPDERLKVVTSTLSTLSIHSP